MNKNKNKIKEYAPKARRELIDAVAAKAQILGLSDKKIEPVEVKGDLAIIAGRPFPRQIAPLRRNLEQAVRREGFDQLVERIAFTWFNRFTALRYMELHGFLDHGYRVLSHSKGGNIPEILEHATDLDLTGLDKAKVAELRLAGSKDNELYRLLLVAQCNALNTALPFLFERNNDETELLLPDNLLHTDSPVRKLVSEIEEGDWNEVEIVGWLYQFYISEKKDAVIGKVVKSQDIPAATQLFTPNWIVKYLTQNTLGRQWVATYPNSALKGKMEFYIEPAEQSEEVQVQLKAITPSELNPEEITFFDPACGSGHILVEAYDLFKQIYEERGYARRDIPRLILEKNLFGLDIDERAAQLAAFALMMRARADDRSLFRAEPPIKLNVMAIKESNGLDIEQIAETLTREQIEVVDGTSKAEEKTLAVSDTKPLQKNLVVTSKSEIDKATLITFLEFFKDAKTFGSLLRIPERFAVLLPTLQKLIDPTKGRDLAGHTATEELRPFVVQTEILAGQYDNVVANPPYMGNKGMNPLLKEFAAKNFSDSKSDLFAVFIERGLNATVSKTGLMGMITMHSWMFLSSFAQLREKLLSQNTICNMTHLGSRAFAEISGEVVQTTAFIMYRKHIPNFPATFLRLVDLNEEEKVSSIKEKKQLHIAKPDDFKKIPGAPVAYWITEAERDLYLEGCLIEQVCFPKKGMDTGWNERFLRLWYEVSSPKCQLHDATSLDTKHFKWFPYNKGGEFRRWYGNREYVVNWFNDGEEIKSRRNEIKNKPSLRNQDYYFREGFTWTTVSSSNFSARFSPRGSLFDNGGCTLFAAEKLNYIGALCNSVIGKRYFEFLSPTLNFQPGDVGKIIYIQPEDSYVERIENNVKKMISLTKEDFDESELSWDFSCCSFVRNLSFSTLQSFFSAWLNESWQKTLRLMNYETENNELLSVAYKLKDKIKTAPPIREITLRCNPYHRYGKDPEKRVSEQFDIGVELETRVKADSIVEFLSYVVGCIMGRYSLDRPGLIYANAGNEGFDPTQYKTFPADDDGIVPVCDIDWFADDATPRLVEFIKTVFGVETLDENLAWIADSFEPKKGETPVETVRRYFSTQFFKNHMQMYKKRPIYWLFSSGKQKAFECLVYLHRYNESTLARMRAQYVTPLQGKLNARIEHLRRETDSTGSTAAKTKLRKEVEMLVKKQTELAKFDEELRHYADQRIKLDLDDGVRVNYGKFGTLLAETKAITGGSEE